MKRTTARRGKTQGRTRKSPAEAAEQAGYGPKITVERGFLVLRWSREQAAEALDSAGMSPEELLRIHLIPRLEATKTIPITIISSKRPYLLCGFSIQRSKCTPFLCSELFIYVIII